MESLGQCHRISVVRRKVCPRMELGRAHGPTMTLLVMGAVCILFGCSEVSLQGVAQGTQNSFCVSVHLVFQVGHSREAENSEKDFPGVWVRDGGGLD